MALKTFVKVSNVSNLSDARYCAGMMIDIIGFNLNDSNTHYVDPKNFKEITDWVSGVAIAGEFERGDKKQIIQALHNYNIDYIQISEQANVEKINLLGKPLIFKLHVNSVEEYNRLKSKLSYLDELVEIVIIKSNNPLLFEQLDTFIQFYYANCKLLKGYGFERKDHLKKFPGIELEATPEEKTGFKDYGEVMDILESLEVDN